MVCNRCILVVENEMKRLGFSPSVTLGEVDVHVALNSEQLRAISEGLKGFGFELIDDKKGQIIEKIKTIIIDVIYNKDNKLKNNLSDFLAQEIGQDYSAISQLFSEVENNTIEKYYISQKIERVKELIIYDELSLSEIAAKLNYSSVAHLSNQFKKMTGFTPSHFKQLKENRRKQIDQL